MPLVRISLRRGKSAAHLAAQQGAGDAADDSAGLAALLRHLGLHVVGTAFLARRTHLLDARLDARHAAEVLEIAGLCLGQRQGAHAQGGENQFGFDVHAHTSFWWCF